MTKRNILGAATMPKAFSQMFLSRQEYKVGNKVESKTVGGGNTLYGHQRKGFGSASWNSAC